MIRCNECFREVVREYFCDALSKVSGEADEKFRDGVNACDFSSSCIALESAMFEKWGRSDGPYKIKYTTVLVTLRILKSQISEENSSLGRSSQRQSLTSGKEMASDKMLQLYQQERQLKRIRRRSC